MIEHPLVEDFSIVPFFFDLSTKKQTYAFIFVHSAQLDRVLCPGKQQKGARPHPEARSLFIAL